MSSGAKRLPTIARATVRSRRECPITACSNRRSIFCCVRAARMGYLARLDMALCQTGCARRGKTAVLSIPSDELELERHLQPLGGLENLAAVHRRRGQIRGTMRALAPSREPMLAAGSARLAGGPGAYPQHDHD